jgi:hypothetical protein
MECAIAKAIQLKYGQVALLWYVRNRRMPCSCEGKWGCVIVAGCLAANASLLLPIKNFGCFGGGVGLFGNHYKNFPGDEAGFRHFLSAEMRSA